MASTDIASVCTYCGVGCDITAVVKNNQIQKIYAQADGYVSRGKLCIKGKTGYHFLNSSKRIKGAMIKKTFIQKNFDALPKILKAKSKTLKSFDNIWYKSDYDFATSITAWKLDQIKQTYTQEAFHFMGGARTSCESAYLFQKFARESIKTPNIDNCARVCHAPSLAGLKQTIGEGAATNPYNDIFEAEFIFIIGSNTTEAHPIIANRIIEAVKNNTAQLAVLDVRSIQIAKKATFAPLIPFESNLLVLNALAYTILKENLENKDFINKRVKGFKHYKQQILNDKYANPAFFKTLKGYEYLAEQLPQIARQIATKKTMFFWGLGVTEHLDGSYGVMAISNLALLTGNIAKTGAGLMPLRGQNNVQGACDMGCLPYYNPDYQTPKKIGLMTPEAIDKMLENKIKALYVMGEDLTHIHPNINKINKAINNLEFMVVQDLFLNNIASKADIVFGVKSAYEKIGVYVNAMRRLHLSQPLIKSNLPDDWEILKEIENKINGEFLYDSVEDIWNEVRTQAPNRFSGASYTKLRKHRAKGMQWPINKTDTPILHIKSFRTDDGLGNLIYHQYTLRNQVKNILSNQQNIFYLTTGRTIVHYNNISQTIQTKSLNERYNKDILLVSYEDKEFFKNKSKVILKSIYGQSGVLTIKISKQLKRGTMFVTFHHPESKINYLFGDESDNLVKTACFKSIEVKVLEV